MTSQGPSQPIDPQDLPNWYGASQMKPQLPTGNMVIIPADTFSDLLAAADCSRTCRVWEDDICSCGREKIREKARAFLK